jgi:catechol 2,3-dioxygenase-like lactoylglutathione lyase family enzyme
MIRRLEHYNIRTTRFAETVRFYVEVLGMRNAPPPGAPEAWPPSWIYDDEGVPVVHLLPVDPSDPQASYAQLSGFRGDVDAGEPPAFHGSGAIDHVAFQCVELDECISRLRAAQIPYAENHVSQIDLHQIFVKDPNGVTIELNFRR